MASHHFVFNAWVSFASALLLMVASGTVYLFPVYSTDLADALSLTQAQINTVGTFMNAGTFIGVVNGIIYDWAVELPPPGRPQQGAGRRWCACVRGPVRGARWTSVLGAGLLLGGYVAMYLAATHQIEINYLALGVCMFCLGQGSGFTFVAGFNTNAMNFPKEHRGRVMGIMVCFFGLSAGICAQLYKGFFAPGPAGAALFLRFLAFALAGIAVITSPFINILPPHVDGSRHSPATRIRATSSSWFGLRSWSTLGSAMVLAALIGSSAAANAIDSDAPALPFAATMVVVLMLFVLLLPCGSGAWGLSVPVSAFAEADEGSAIEAETPPRRSASVASSSPATPNTPTSGTAEFSAPLLSAEARASKSKLGSLGVMVGRSHSRSSGSRRSGFGEVEQAHDFASPPPASGGGGAGARSTAAADADADAEQKDHTLLQCLTHLDFWLLFAVFGLNIGCSVTSLDNMDAIIQSKAMPGTDILSIRVGSAALFSVADTIGRLSSGFAMDAVAKRYNVPRVAWCMVASALLMLSQLLMALVGPQYVYVAAIVQALGHGTTFSAVPTATSEFWGLAHLGATFGFLGMSPAVGSEVFSSLLAGKLYAKFCPGAHRCWNVPDAYKYTMLCTAAACGCAMVAGAVLFCRRRRSSLRR